MPKPVKKAVRKRRVPPKPKRPSGLNLAARAALMEHLVRLTADEPADKPPTFDELYRAHMAELGAKGGKISGARRMQMPVGQRKAIAVRAARARWKKPRKG